MPLESPETDEATKLAIIKENHERSAALILESYYKAQELAQGSKETAIQAIEEARRCGAMCNAKKTELEEKVGKGHWEKWVETYLAEIKKGASTIRRYMQFEKRSQCERFEQSSPKSLRQAFVVTGIFPDPVEGQRIRLNGQSKPLKGSNGKTNALTLFHQLMSEKPIEMMIQTLDFSSWETNALEIWVRETAPFASMRSRMIDALERKLKG